MGVKGGKKRKKRLKPLRLGTSNGEGGKSVVRGEWGD